MPGTVRRLVLVAGVVLVSVPLAAASAQEPPDVGELQHTEIGQQDQDKRSLDGSPTDPGHLPDHITQLTETGMRPDWSPDGRRLVYLDDNLGDVWELDLATGRSRNLTAAVHPVGVLRAHHLQNGDLLLCGPAERDPDDPDSDRFRGELWVLRTPYTSAPVPLETPCWEGIVTSRQPGSTLIAWAESEINFSDPDVFVQAATGRSQIFTGVLVYEDGVPTLTDRTLVVDRYDVGPDAIVEPQDFRAGDGELIFSTYFHRGGEVYGVVLDGDDAGTLTNYSQSPWYEEAEGIFPDGESVIVERDLAIVVFPGENDLWRLSLDGEATYERLTFFNHHDGYGATNPVVHPSGDRFAFQLETKEGEIGEGAGLLLYDLEAAQAAGTDDEGANVDGEVEGDEDDGDTDGTDDQDASAPSTDATPPLPVTGGGLVVPGLLLLAAAAGVIRRR